MNKTYDQFIYDMDGKRFGNNLNRFWTALKKSASGMTTTEFAKEFIEPPNPAQMVRRIITSARGIPKRGHKKQIRAILESDSPLIRAPSFCDKDGEIDYESIASTIWNVPQDRILLLTDHQFRHNSRAIFPYTGLRLHKKHKVLTAEPDQTKYLDERIEEAINSVLPNRIYIGLEWEPFAENKTRQVLHLNDIIRGFFAWNGLSATPEVTYYPGAQYGRETGTKAEVEKIISFSDTTQPYDAEIFGLSVWDKNREALQQKGGNLHIQGSNFPKTRYAKLSYYREAENGRRTLPETDWGYAHVIAMLGVQKHLNELGLNVLLPFPKIFQKAGIYRYFGKILNNILIEEFDAEKQELMYSNPNIGQQEYLLWALIGSVNKYKSMAAQDQKQ